IVLDEPRGVLYVANFAARHVAVISTADNTRRPFGSPESVRGFMIRSYHPYTVGSTQGNGHIDSKNGLVCLQIPDTSRPVTPLSNSLLAGSAGALRQTAGFLHPG